MAGTMAKRRQRMKQIKGYILLTCRVFEEDGLYVGECVELGVSSFGNTVGEALDALAEATTLYMNTLEAEGQVNRVLKERGLKITPAPRTRTLSVRARPGEVIAPRSVPVHPVAAGVG